MPERLLDEANVLGLAIQLCGKRVPQHVRVHILVAEPGFLAPPLHHGTQGGAIDGRALPRGEEEARRAGMRCSKTHVCP